MALLGGNYSGVWVLIMRVHIYSKIRTCGDLQLLKWSCSQRYSPALTVGDLFETVARKGETFGLTFAGGGQGNDRAYTFYTDALDSRKSQLEKKLDLSESAPHRGSLQAR